MTAAVSFLLALLAAGSSPAAPVTAGATVKRGPLVLAVSGPVSLVAAPTWTIAPRSFLTTGDTLRLAPGARVVLAFRSGRRYEAQGPALVRVGSDGLNGPGLRELARLPAWPVRIRPEEVRGTRPAGLRVRAGRIEGLRPADGGAVLADEAWLSFAPEASASTYAIEVRDRRGRLAYSARSSAEPLRVPAGRLQAGSAYYWTVETLGDVGPGAEGEAAFRTLSLDEARDYASTRERLRASPDAEARVYLTAIEASLGLPEGH